MRAHWDLLPDTITIQTTDGQRLVVTAEGLDELRDIANNIQPGRTFTTAHAEWLDSWYNYEFHLGMLLEWATDQINHRITKLTAAGQADRAVVARHALGAQPYRRHPNCRCTVQPLAARPQ